MSELTELPRGESLKLEPLYEVAAHLIRADTVSHRGNAEVMAWLAQRLEEAGLRAALQETEEAGARKANLVAVAGPDEPGGLVLSGHVDVVPFADQPGWSREPLRLTGEGKRLYGRGTSDMKGFLAQCVEAMRRLDPDSLQRPVVLVFTSDEEIGCRGADRLVPELPRLLGDTPLPGWAWIGEPTSGRVFHAHKGVVAFEVTVEGRGGHSSVPEAGCNAIAVAARAIAEVGALQAELRASPGATARELFPEAPYATLNLGTIQGGSALNMIAERCRFSVSYRPLPEDSPLGVYEALRERLATLDARDPGAPDERAAIRLGEPLVAPGLLAARGSALEEALLSAPGAAPGGGAPFCTDAGQLARAGLQSLVCGPGELEQAHQPDESIDRAAFEAGPERILRVLERLCGARARA